MDRRHFIKTSVILSSISILPSFLVANKIKLVSDIRVFNITFKHKIINNSKNLRLWIPLPLQDKHALIFQKVNDFKYNGNYTKAMISDKEIPTLYAQYNKNGGAILDLSFSIETTERITNWEKVNYQENEKLPPEISFYLKPTKYIQTNKAVREQALKITKGLKGDIEKAKAIFIWTVENVIKDEEMIGCSIINSKKKTSKNKLFGKCTDISTVFVGLCRSIGIPAREIHGIKLGQSRFSKSNKSKSKTLDISSSQHTKAEFYIKGYGWIPCDPSEVVKIKTSKGLSNDDYNFFVLRDYFFGNWEMNWLGYNAAYDFSIKPQSMNSPLNNFGYPYGEDDGRILDYYLPLEFSYTYQSTEAQGS